VGGDGAGHCPVNRELAELSGGKDKPGGGAEV